MERFMKIAVEPKLANDIGSIKGTIYEPRITNRSVGELTTLWKDLGVIHVEKHIRKDDNGDTSFTGKITLIFKGETLPEKILVGDQSRTITPWVRSVLQCKKCHKFNHFAKNCTNKFTCSKCSIQHEESDECPTPILKCSNCRQIGHGARDKKCSHYEREKEICEIRTNHGVGYRRAKEIREEMEKTQATGYTSITGGRIERKSGPMPGTNTHTANSRGQNYNSKGRNNLVGDSWNEPDHIDRNKSTNSPWIELDSNRKSSNYNKTTITGGKFIPDNTNRYQIPTFDFSAEPAASNSTKYPSVKPKTAEYTLERTEPTLVRQQYTQAKNSFSQEQPQLQREVDNTISMPYNTISMPYKGAISMPHNSPIAMPYNGTGKYNEVLTGKYKTVGAGNRGNNTVSTSTEITGNRYNGNIDTSMFNPFISVENRYQALSEDETDEQVNERIVSHNNTKRKISQSKGIVDTNNNIKKSRNMIGIGEVTLVDKFTTPIQFQKVEVSTQTEASIEKVIIPTKYKESVETTDEATDNNDEVEANTVSIIQQLCSTLARTENIENTIKLLCELIQIVSNKKIDTNRIQSALRSSL